MDHHAELEQFGIRHKFRRRPAKQPVALLEMPRRVKYRCMACGNEFWELERYFRSVEPHEVIHEVAPWDEGFEVTPMPKHNMTDTLRTI